MVAMAMSSTQLEREDRAGQVGAAAALEAAERRRAMLSDAKHEWLLAFDEFKRQEARFEAASGLTPAASKTAPVHR
jgi:hypothetical protein